MPVSRRRRLIPASPPILELFMGGRKGKAGIGSVVLCCVIMPLALGSGFLALYIQKSIQAKWKKDSKESRQIRQL